MGVYYPPVEEHENVIKASLRVIEGTHYQRASDPHADAEQQYGEEQLALAARALAEAVDRKPADEQPVGWDKDRDIEHDAIHKHFGLSYANYLVIPRTLLQSMTQEWQAKFVGLLREMDEAFEHVPQADCYKVEAVTEHIVNEMGHDLLEEAGITEDWYDEPVPEDLGPSDLNEWRAEHEKDAPTYYDRDGNQLAPEHLVTLPAEDPVAHYNRGRTRVEPRLGGGE